MRYDGGAAAYGIPRNAAGAIALRAAERSLRPSQIPARLAPKDTMRVGVPAELWHVQPKLMVGNSNDPLEDEADRVADQVMGIAEPPAAVASPQITRKYSGDEEAEKEEAQPLQLKRATHAAAAGEAPAVVTALLGWPGRPLDAGARQFMEPRLGHDLSDVRIHTGPLAVPVR